MSRSHSEAAGVAARARSLLAVAEGKPFAVSAREARRRSGDAICKREARFTQEGLSDLESRHGGGPEVVYGEAARARILADLAPTPDPEKDGTAVWSKATLQRALRRAPNGLPNVSTYTIRGVLHEAGYRSTR